MDLPVMPPVSPMLARSVKEIPDTGHVEPKWDGFRSIVFRDGDEVVLGSRNERPLTRYFPELVEAVLANTPDRCVLDGEIVVVTGDRLDFETLQLRLHPAASRVTRLAGEIPASFVAFDLLALGDRSLMDVDLGERRTVLVEALAGAGAPIHVTPATGDMALARQWFETFEGAGLDGVVAKPLTGPYLPDKRVMFKVKHERTADCVVAGFRWHKSGPIVGSLLLGLYDESGALQHVGVSASFPMARRAALVEELAPYRIAIGEAGAAGHPWAAWADAQAHTEGRLPGAVSRWSTGKDLSWEPLRPEVVVEVAYDHMEGTRFRHTAQFRRWRPDRDPASCGYDQLDRPVRYDLARILG
ncbi:MAG: ATP-dependent DNA ligase [Kineosporiaceae bacterium]